MIGASNNVNKNEAIVLAKLSEMKRLNKIKEANKVRKFVDNYQKEKAIK